MSRPTRAEINRDAIRHNAALVRSLAPDARMMAVVKANAYGHGATEVSRCLEPVVDALAVACLEEALELRDAGIAAPILLLEGVFNADEWLIASQQALWVTVENEAQLSALEQASLPQPVSCWVKVDTGMHRLGFAPAEVLDVVARLAGCPGVAGDPVLFTHFADAETAGSNATADQLAGFEAVGLSLPRSACNSAGVLRLPHAHYDWVRPGYMLYGNSPLAESTPATEQLRPALALRSAVSSLRTIERGQSVGYGGKWTAQRTTRIATVPIGYGDGYPRSAPAGTPVLVKEQRAVLAGRVSMDMITVDVTDLQAVAIGDPVTLWGPGLGLHEIAEHVGTNGYELTTRMSRRITRTYLDA